jgi:hypothetical protein
MAEVRKVTTPDRFLLDISEAEMEHLMDALAERSEADKDADRLYADLADAVYSETDAVTPSQVVNYGRMDATDGGTTDQYVPPVVPGYRC